METTRKTTFVWDPVKVHLHDGSVVVFKQGWKMVKGEVKGEGVRYDLLRRKAGRVESVPCDSVACLQVYKDKFLGRRSTAGLVAGPIYFFTLLVYAVSTLDDHVRR